jgi:ATP/maltotriose-dependent transcriptional regulator MalT
LHFCAVLSQRLSQMDRQYSQRRNAFHSLAEEFYSKRPADEQQFYRHAALLTTLDPKIIGTLLQTDNSATFLADLENSQLPLIRRVDGGHELHGFFREFLIEKLLAGEGAEKKIALHVGFSSIYEKQSNWGQAIHQSLEAKDWPTVGRLLVAHKDELLDNSPAIVKDAVARLPSEDFNADVALVHIQAEALYRLGDPAGAVSCVKEARARRDRASALRHRRVTTTPLTS